MRWDDIPLCGDPDCPSCPKPSDSWDQLQAESAAKAESNRRLCDIDFDVLPYASAPAQMVDGRMEDDYYRTYVLPNDGLVVEFERKYRGGPFSVSRVWHMMPGYPSDTDFTPPAD